MIHGSPQPPVSDQQLEEIEFRALAADDAQFTVAARADVPLLIAEIRRTRRDTRPGRVGARRRVAVLAATGAFLIAATVNVFSIGGWAALGGAFLALAGTFVLGWVAGSSGD